jgi:adenylate cyclase
MNETQTREAERALGRALALDPQSLDAMIGLAQTLTNSIYQGWSSAAQQDIARAEQLLLEALDRDPDRSAAHTAMANLRRLQNRSAESRIEAEKAIALDPNDPYAHIGSAYRSGTRASRRQRSHR